MGVHSLWDIVGPAAKPVKLEALSRKKLAVDASIWIYQFLKAVRDKEGNAMGQSHIVGFFRRLCKMLYFGILPLFVFDGGAPALKRRVIQRRRERREGNSDSVSTTAQKLLLIQMNKRRDGANGTSKSGANGASKSGANGTSKSGANGGRQPGRRGDPTTNLADAQVDSSQIYFEDLPSNQPEAQVTSGPLGAHVPPGQSETLFRRKDEYHLPEIKQFRVKRNDERILPPEEFEEFGEDHDFNVVDGIPIDSVDPSSREFAELPTATQYMILNHLRLRSRLRMGYTKDQLVGLFPNSKDFSKFQIQQVQKRNFYTQSLMNVSGMAEDSGNVSKRIAGDKDRQYMLVKNEGGWTLSLGSENVDEGPIDLDRDYDLEGFAYSGGEALGERVLGKEASKGVSSKKVSNKRVFEVSDKDVTENRASVVASPAMPVDSDKSVKEESIDSDSDILEDVSLDGSDDDKNRELIESLYDRYAEPKDLNENPQSADMGSIAGFSEAQLKEAVKQSKEEYFTEKKAQEAYDLSQSLLFSTGAEKESENKKIYDEFEGEEKDGFEKDRDSEDEHGQKEIEKKKETPSWFIGPQDLQQNSIGVLSEENRATLNEDEEAGLISWAEAKERYDQAAASNAPEWIEIDEEGGHDEPQSRDIVDLSEDSVLSEAETGTSGSGPKQPEELETELGTELETELGTELGTELETEELETELETDGVQEMQSVFEKSAQKKKHTSKSAKSEKPKGPRKRAHNRHAHASAKPGQSDSLHEPSSICEQTASGNLRGDIPQQHGHGTSSNASHGKADGKANQEDSQENATQTPDGKKPSVTAKRQGARLEEAQAGDSARDQAGDSARNQAVERTGGAKTVVMDYDFSEDEENNLRQQLHEEEDDYDDFSRRIQDQNLAIHTKVGSEQLLQEQLQKARRDADEVTQTMVNDVQELLRRFGVPYITAPMEAEAQCAKLFQMGLVDGIITDDSDCFLFGGSRIYKNMFNQKQYVECYMQEDIEHKIGLSQHKLIDLALLLGSDYTEGIKGIGPVLAMEILAEFGDLDTFKTWFSERKAELSGGGSGVQCRTKLEKSLVGRIKNGKLFLDNDFPSQQVRTAYTHPDIDPDASEFKWGVPSLDQIRSFLMYNVGWTQQRVDEVMVPLVRNMNKARTDGVQTTVGEFFPQEYISFRKDIGMGKRMKLAAERMRK